MTGMMGGEEYGAWRVLVCAALALTVALFAYRGLESCGARWLPLALLLGTTALVLAFVGAERITRPTPEPTRDDPHVHEKTAD